MQLVCTGTVKVPLKVAPRVISFPRVDRDAEEVTRVVRITRGDGGPIKPELVPPADKHVEATLEEVEPGEEYELTVKLRPPWPNRSLRSTVTIKTGVKESPTETVRIFASIAPRLVGVPNRFMIPSEVKKDMELRSRLMWSGNRPGKVLEVNYSDPKAKVELTEVKGDQMIVLHIPKGYRLPPPGRAYVTVKTDDKSAPVLRIPVYASRLPRTPIRPSAVRKPGIQPPRGTTLRPSTQPAGAKPVVKPHGSQSGGGPAAKPKPHK